MSKPPMRSFRLTIRAEADTAADLGSELCRIANQIECGKLSFGVSAGVTSGSIYELLHDPNQTHDEYVKQVNEYLQAKTANTQHGITT